MPPPLAGAAGIKRRVGQRLQEVAGDNSARDNPRSRSQAIALLSLRGALRRRRTNPPIRLPRQARSSRLQIGRSTALAHFFDT